MASTNHILFFFFLFFFYFYIFSFKGRFPDAAKMKSLSFEDLSGAFGPGYPDSEDLRRMRQLADLGVVHFNNVNYDIFPPSGLHLTAWKLQQQGLETGEIFRMLAKSAGAK